MHFSTLFLTLWAGTITVTARRGAVQKRATTSCSTPSGVGFCQSTSSTCGGTYYAGYCPGASTIQCCVSTCSTPSGSGVCEPTANTCSGTYVSGYCSGASDVKCCVSSGSTTATGSSGFDISGTQTAAFWTCAASTYKVVAIEGYIQGCSVGGEVSSSFVANYKAAKAAGMSRIDVYLFPCTGTQSNGVACKSPTTQINELLASVKANAMTISHYWFDIEPTSSPCQGWNLGSAANAALAKQWVTALQATGLTWGIYANGNQWTTMFAARTTDIGSQLPLWAVQDDDVAGVNTVTTYMGGWTTASAKQYLLDTTACGGSVDLDSFL